MGTQSHVSYAIEQTLKNCLPDSPEPQIENAARVLSDIDGGVWQTIARWGENNAWERADDMIQRLEAQGKAARKVALAAHAWWTLTSPENKEDAEATSRALVSLFDAVREWAEVYVENNDDEA